VAFRQRVSFEAGDCAPNVGVPTLLRDIEEHGAKGRLFCFLPLPISLDLPVHVHGSLELSSSRRDIWKLDEGASRRSAALSSFFTTVLQA
jgi:hypothetical protein